MSQITNERKSYANATSSDVFPTKDQAIVIEAREGISIKEYTNEVAKITDPRNIRFISRISNNRICIFLSSKEEAENLTDKHKLITIKDQELTIRPLINKHKRVIISNVCPVIPHMIIEKELAKLKIKNTTKISFLRAGIHEANFSHIMSFRRQMFVDPDDLKKKFLNP